MTAISVIVPVYNVEGYLERCVNSILHQTFQDFEVVLVDDGSTDSSGEMCDEYAKKCNKIRVFHKENGGPSDARNRGLEEAVGEYFVFVDSDDYIDKRYLEVLYRIAKAHGADLVICDAVNVWKGKHSYTEQEDWREAICSTEAIPKVEAYRRVFLCEHMAVTVWAKLYHKNLFREIRYPKGEIHEDVGIIEQIIESSDKIMCTRYQGYFYVRRRGSIVHGKMGPQHMIKIENAKHLWEFTKERYPQIEDTARIFYLNSMIQLINLMVMERSGSYDRECRRLRKKS